MKHVIGRHVEMPLALAIELLVSVGERAIFPFALSRSMDVRDEVDSIVMNVVLVGIPFFVLAFRSSSRVTSWVLAFTLTALIRGWWLSKGIAYQRAPDGSGVDMFGALMMLISPLAIALIAVAVESALRWHAKSANLHP